MFTPIIGVADIAAREGSPHNVLHSSSYYFKKRDTAGIHGIRRPSRASLLVAVALLLAIDYKAY